MYQKMLSVTGNYPHLEAHVPLVACYYHDVHLLLSVAVDLGDLYVLCLFTLEAFGW